MPVPFKAHLTVYDGGMSRWRATFRHGKPAGYTDLTDFKGRMTVSATKSSDRILMSLTTENGGIVLGGMNGSIAVFAPAGQVPYRWPAGKYELELTSPRGEVLHRALVIESAST